MLTAAIYFVFDAAAVFTAPLSPIGANLVFVGFGLAFLLWLAVLKFAFGLERSAWLFAPAQMVCFALFLLIGHRTEVVAYGAVLALPGLVQAAAFAWLRYGYLRLPPARAYPGAAVNSIATAVIDEATFRGALLGALLAVGLPDGGAILVATIVYVLATRLAAPGHHPYPVLLAGAMGLAFGWATLASGGIGAAIIGHAITSFAVFVCTGHAGQVPLSGLEPEDLERRARLPEGWQDARRPLSPGLGAESRGFAEAPGQSGFSTRADRRVEPVRHSGGLMRWARATSRAVTPQIGRRSR